MSSIHLRATIVVATLVALFAVAAPAHATPFSETFYFSNTPTVHECAELPCPQTYSPTDQANAGNSIGLSMDISSPFPDTLSVIATQFADAELASNLGYTCLPYADSGGCVEYSVFFADSNGNPVSNPTPDIAMIDSSITVTIAWVKDTNPIIPTILHVDQPGEGNCPADSSGPCAETLTTTYYPFGTIRCPTCGDPADSGSTDNFSRFAVVYATPEPATASLLLVTGLAGAVIRRRRAAAGRALTRVTRSCAPSGGSHRGRRA